MIQLLYWIVLDCTGITDKVTSECMSSVYSDYFILNFPTSSRPGMSGLLILTCYISHRFRRTIGSFSVAPPVET